jgi:hypothetical protein
MNWFYRRQGREVGPVTAGQLKQLAVAGTIDATTPVRRETDKRWYPACKVQGLFPQEPPPAAVPAHAAPAAEPGARPVSLALLAVGTVLGGALGGVGGAWNLMTIGGTSRYDKWEEVFPSPYWLVALLVFTAGTTAVAYGIGLWRGNDWGRLVCLATFASVTLLMLPLKRFGVFIVVAAAAVLLIYLAFYLFVLYRRRAREFFAAHSSSAGRRDIGKAIGLGLAALQFAVVFWVYAYEAEWLDRPPRRHEVELARQLGPVEMERRRRQAEEFDKKLREFKQKHEEFFRQRDEAIRARHGRHDDESEPGRGSGRTNGANPADG